MASLRTLPFVFGLLGVSANALVGCGGITSGPTGSAGGAAGSQGTGTGAGTGTTGSAGTGSTGGTGGSSNVGRCGGLAAVSCESNQYCDYPADDCGKDNGPGVCKVRQANCD